jgi:hypothetical protein
MTTFHGERAATLEKTTGGTGRCRRGGGVETVLGPSYWLKSVTFGEFFRNSLYSAIFFWLSSVATKYLPLLHHLQVRAYVFTA